VDGTIRIALPVENGDASGAIREPITKLASKGERVTFGTTLRDGAKTGFITQSAPTDPVTAIAWTRGQLIFRGEPLAEVIGAINGYIARPADRLTLKDPAAARTRVFGIVNQGDPAAIRDLIDNPEVVGQVDGR
jgi:transmembrane sensor